MLTVALMRARSFKLETVTNAQMFSHAAHRQQQLNSASPCSLIFVVGGR